MSIGCKNLWILVEIEQKRLAFGEIYRHPIITVKHITLFEKS